MPRIEKHAPGTPCWVELCTSDLKAGLAFYEGLFGWTSFEMPAHGAGAFVMLRKDGVEIGASYQISTMQTDKGIAPHWLVYFCSEDAKATLEKVTGAGGSIVFGPFDLGKPGSSCFFRDPHGALFACWQPNEHIGSGIVEEPGTLNWPELATPNAEESKAFYTKVFGWGAAAKEVDAGGTSMTYTEWMSGEKPIGGCLQMTAEWEGIPPHWMLYFQVENCADSVDKVKELGGTVKFGPLPIPNVGLFAVALDPQGIPFSIIERQH